MRPTATRSSWDTDPPGVGAVIEDAETPIALLQIPDAMNAGTIPPARAVNDSGHPRLTRYGRVRIEAGPGGRQAIAIGLRGPTINRETALAHPPRNP